jgi:hypothetical protein
VEHWPQIVSAQNTKQEHETACDSFEILWRNFPSPWDEYRLIKEKSDVVEARGTIGKVWIHEVAGK